jgi:NTE family protein
MLREMSDPGHSEGGQWARMRVHRIASEQLLKLGASSKMLAEWDFLTMLRDEGRRSAEQFLETSAGDLGKRSSYDLDVLLQGV